MKKSKKVLLIVLIVVLVILSLVAVGLFLYNKELDKNEKKEQEANLNAEENFKKLFLNLEYSENKNDAVTLSYKIEKSEQGKYDVDANVPLLNIETDIAKAINDEINNIFGRKLYEIIKNNTVYTKYSVDYITYTNNNIISLIIKATLKEGSNPQRFIVQTYNYNIEENKLVSLEEYLNKCNINKELVQSQIINYIRDKSIGSTDLLKQGYNIYVRDIRSEEYLIENINNYFIGQDGKLYIVFAYGNINFTETVDVVII